MFYLVDFFNLWISRAGVLLAGAGDHRSEEVGLGRPSDHHQARKLLDTSTGDIRKAQDTVLREALGADPQSWLRMQVAYDLWHAQKRRPPKIVPSR